MNNYIYASLNLFIAAVSVASLLTLLTTVNGMLLGICIAILALTTALSTIVTYEAHMETKAVEKQTKIDAIIAEYELSD